MLGLARSVPTVSDLRRRSSGQSGQGEGEGGERSIGWVERLSLSRS